MAQRSGVVTRKVRHNGPVVARISLRAPRKFESAREVAGDLMGVWVRAPVLSRVYVCGVLDAKMRERIMVAVSRTNACSGCTAVHERWALRTGVSSTDLEAIGLGDLARLDERSRAAVVYATALAENRFRGVPDPELVEMCRRHLTAVELVAVEAVARMMAVANLSNNTLRFRLRRSD